MIKKFIGFFLAFAMLFSIANASITDPQRELTGKQMIVGAPWIGDDKYLYFGNDKDGSIRYDETTNDKLTIGGAVLFSGTVATGTSAIALNGDTTIASGKTLAVTDADKLTVNGVIVPQAITVSIPLSAATVNGSIYIPISGNYQILGIQEVHSVASTAAYTSVNAKIVKCTGTQAPATAGTLVMTNSFDLKAAAETIQSATLSAVSGATKVNTTERLGIRFNDPITSLAGGCISISLKRIA